LIVAKKENSWWSLLIKKRLRHFSTALSDRFRDQVLLLPDTRGVKYEKTNLIEFIINETLKS